MRSPLIVNCQKQTWRTATWWKTSSRAIWTSGSCGFSNNGTICGTATQWRRATNSEFRWKFYIFRILPFNPIIWLWYAFNLFRIASVTPLLSPLPHKSHFISLNYFKSSFKFCVMRAWKSYISLIVICAKLWNSISIYTRSCVCLNRPASRSTG